MGSAQDLAKLTRPHLLILDDFAMREYTAGQADDLYELISERTHAWSAPVGRASTLSPAASAVCFAWSI